MKHAILLLFFAFVLMASCACEKNAGAFPSGDNITDTTGFKMKVIIGTSIFSVTLNDNATAAGFKKLLPLTVEMEELNGNEKYIDLSASLPSSASNPGTIQAGDLMLYGSNTLVLFYKSFSTPYNYTPLGHVDNTAGLAAALGSGNITVRFEAE